MKRLLLASILMAFGASAQAGVTVGTIDCIGQETSRTCTASLTCTGSCTTDVILNEIVDCIPLPLGTDVDVTRIVADREGTTNPSPQCVWDVTDVGGDGSTTRVTISSADGLPVELQSLSVE
jgi:hypothetical protein